VSRRSKVHEAGCQSFVAPDAELQQSSIGKTSAAFESRAAITIFTGRRSLKLPIEMQKLQDLEPLVKYSLLSSSILFVKVDGSS
jgi:hypothetical protein